MIPEQDQRELVTQCLETIETTAHRQRELLQQALKATEVGRESTDAQQAPGSNDSGSRSEVGASSDRQWWRWQRLLVLQHLERLDTALALYKGMFHPEAYRQLRDCTVAEAASALAAVQRWRELGVLLERHPYALLPSALDALAAAPETADPKQLAPLLHQVARLREPPALARPADWVECQPTVEELRASERYSLLLATESLAALSVGWHPPPARRLAAWVCERALALDDATGQLHLALALLEAGRAALHYGEQALNELLEAAHQLSAILRVAASRGADSGEAGRTWRLALRRYASLGPLPRLQALLVLVGVDALAEDLGVVVAPFLSRMDGVDTDELLCQALEQEAASRLSWVVRLIQLESEQRCLFASTAGLARAAAAAVHGSCATDAWEMLEAALNAAWEALAADGELDREQGEECRELLHATRGHLVAARLLTKHGLATQARMVRDANRQAAEGLVRTLLARVSRAKNSESRWVEVWADLQTACAAGLPQLPERAVRAELAAALLRCAQFRLAAGHLAALDPERAERLVVAAGRDYFLSAPSLGDKAVRQAQECFAVLPASAAVQQELERVQAALRLHDMGIELAPVQLHQAAQQGPAGTRQLLDQILASHPRLAQDADGVMRVADALGAGASKAQLMLQSALAALAAGDLAQAEGVALQLARQRHEPAWELAAAVAAHPGCSSAAVRQQLLSFALLHAPTAQLPALLGAWEATDAAAGGTGWLRPDVERPSSITQPLEAQLAAYLASASARASASSSGSSRSRGGGRRLPGQGDAEELPTLCCLLALGASGLRHWEGLLQEQQGSLTYAQKRQTLVLGLTASLLLALRPSSPPSDSVQALLQQAEAAQGLLELSPGELLVLWREQAGAGSTPAGSKLKSSLSSASCTNSMRSEGVSEGGEAATSGGPASPRHRQRQSDTEAALAAAAAEAVERFLSLLASTSDAQRVQQLLPGLDAAAALAASGSDPESRRQVVLQLARAAACQGGGSDSTSLTVSGSPRRSLGAPMADVLGAAAGAGVSSSGDGGRQLRASPGINGSWKRVEAGVETSCSWSSQLDAEKAAGMLQDALQLAERYALPSWQVHLAFAQSLLVSHQAQQQQPQVQELLQHAWPAVLERQESAAAALTMLLHVVWPSTSFRALSHLLLCLQLMVEACTSLATADSRHGAAWEQAAAVLSSARAAAASLADASPGIDVKPFLQPLLLAASTWGAGLAMVCATQQQQPQQLQQPASWPVPSSAELAQHLLPHLMPSSMQQVADAVTLLNEAAAGSDALVGAQGIGTHRYPLSAGDIAGVLACKLLADGGGDPEQAVQAACALLPRLDPSMLVGVASFAAASGPCPLELPLASPALPDPPLELLLAAALRTMDGAAATEQLGAEERERLTQLRQQHALLATMSRCRAAAGDGLPGPRLHLLQQAAAQVQQAPSRQAGEAALVQCLGELLVAGCDVLVVLSSAFELAGLAKPSGAAEAAEGATGDVSAQLVQSAAQAAVAAALDALGSSGTSSSSSGSMPTSPGDAIQDLVGITRALDSPSSQMLPSAAPAINSLRAGVWLQLQQHLAASEEAALSSTAAAEARLQVLELLGTLGTSVWTGFVPPAEQSAALAAEGGFNHHQALRLARVGAALAAADWPGVAQQCGLTASHFASDEAAEGAVLRLVDAAAGQEQLQAVIAVLQQVLHQPLVNPAPAAEAAEAASRGPAGDEAVRAVHPLHRAWSACLHALVRRGHLAPVLAALDEAAEQQQQRRQESTLAGLPLLTQQEAQSLLEATDASLDVAAAAALGALMPYPSLRQESERQLANALRSGSASAADLANLPGMAPLLLALCAEQPQPLLPHLAASRSSQHAFTLLCSALLQQEDPALASDLAAGLSLRAAAFAALAAQLVDARQYTAAGWLAMQFTGVHPLLRVLDAGSTALRRLLRSCSSAQPGGRAAPRAALPRALVNKLGVASLAQRLLLGLPARCDAALHHLASTMES